MSASEWARITEERDGAVYHINQLISALLNNFVEYPPQLVDAICEATAFVEENFGDDDE